jgi:hypothetical protein
MVVRKVLSCIAPGATPAKPRRKAPDSHVIRVPREDGPTPPSPEGEKQMRKKAKSRKA